MNRSGAALLLGLLLGAACRPRPAGVPAGPSLEARWAGTDSGRLAAAATAEWCDTLHLLEIKAIQGDTGLGMALYPVSRIQAGRYPVLPPARADSVPPSAAVALRWFGETAIRGFQGESGAVVLEEPEPGTYSGRFDASARSATDGGRLTIRGSFHGLRVGPETRGCVVRAAAPDSGPGVD